MTRDHLDEIIWPAMLVVLVVVGVILGLGGCQKRTVIENTNLGAPASCVWGSDHHGICESSGRTYACTLDVISRRALCLTEHVGARPPLAWDNMLERAP